MQDRFRRWARITVVVLVAAVLAAACSNADDDDGTASGDAETTTTASGGDDTTTTAQADDGGDGGDDGGAATTEAADGEASTTTAAEGSGERDTFVAIAGVPGVSDDEITFAAVGTQANNPLGTCVLDCYVQGIEAYFAWRNDEGGIYGRQLVLGAALDDELSKNLERSTEIASSDAYFGAFSATQVASGWATLDDAGIPTFTWSIHPESAGREHIWGYTGAGCYDCTSRAPAWLARETGATVVASLGYGISENSKRCAGANAASIERYSADIGGVTVGYLNDDLAFGLPNGIGPEVTAMKEAGVDLVLSCLDLNGMQTIAQELRRQGMDDVVMIHPNTYNQEFVTAADGLFEGDYVTVGFVPFEYDTDLELQQKYLEYMELGGNQPSELAMLGWINAHQAFEGLLLAGPEFDRETVTEARNAMTADSAGGLIPAIDWTRQHNPPSEDDNTNDYANECFSAVHIVDGVFEPVVEDETLPFLCWSTDSYEWSEPEPTSFE